MTRNILTAMVLFMLLPSLGLAVEKDRDLEEKEIAHLVNKFVNAGKSGKFKVAYELTTGKERKYYAEIIKQVNMRSGAVPQSVKQYLGRMRECKIDMVEIADQENKAVAICTLLFTYYDSKSRDEVIKQREVLYGLEKVEGEWKISYTKLLQEKYQYKNKSNPKKSRTY